MLVPSVPWSAAGYMDMFTLLKSTGYIFMIYAFLSMYNTSPNTFYIKIHVTLFCSHNIVELLLYPLYG